MLRSSARRTHRLRSARSALIGLLLAAPMVGIAAPSARSAPTPSPAPVHLNIEQFNIEYGGTHVSFASVVEAIKRSGADVVGIEEGQGHIPALQRALGWPYASPRLQILSKYPLIDPPGGNGVYLFIQVAPGQVVAMENVHLPSNPYGPFAVKQGKTKEDVLALEERLRLPAIQPALQAAMNVLAQGIPVFLTGDFNAPSWRDWTPDMVGQRFQIRYPVRWPVSLSVEAAGFHDSFREVYPSPLRHPGLTWWAARPRLPGWNPGKTAPQDRIDFVYAAGAATATASEVIGERGVPGVSVSVSPWPSDHRSVVSTFTVTPGVPPVMVAVDERLVPIGTDVHVVFHAPGGTGERVAVVPAGGDPAPAAIAQLPTGAGVTDGTLAFPTTGWAAGAYEAVLVDGAGTMLSRIPFWTEVPGTTPSIATGKATYAVGEPIDVSWSNARGERWDWVGVYHRGADPRVAYYLLWTYTGSTIAGSASLDDSAHGTWPLPAGKYSVYLLRDDGYRKEAGADFTIAG